MKTVGIIRNRGQLTIPDHIRRFLGWAEPMSAVTIMATQPDELIIKPHNQEIDWDEIWSGIKKARNIKGRGRAISTSKFLEIDRKTH